jgi:hypothetical protein
MRISRVYRLRRRIVAALIIPLLLWCVDASAFVKVVPQDEIKVTLKAVEVKPDHIVITYELIAPATESYEVSLVLLKEGSPSFRVPVRAASGDIGDGKFSGGTREVRWEFAKDYPTGLGGDGFYFEITVTKVKESNLLLYVGLGALAVIGGGVAILGGGKKEGAASSPTPTELPAPPSRPSQ